MTFIFLVPKIATYGDFSHEIESHLFLGKKAMANLESILKSRDITLLSKIHRVKAMVLTLLSDTSSLSGYNRFPRLLSGKESACQCRRCRRGRFDPWVGKLSWRKKWQPTPESLLGEIPWTEYPGGLQSMGSQELDTTEGMSTHMVFLVVMYGCESWMIKKAKHQKIEAGEDSWESFGLQRDQSSQVLRISTPRIL